MERRAFLRFAAMPDVRSGLSLFDRIRCGYDFQIRTRFFMIFGFDFEDIRSGRVEFARIDRFFDYQASRRIYCRIDLPYRFRSRTRFRTEIFIDSTRDIGGRRSFIEGFFDYRVFRDYPAFDIG